VSRSSIQSSGGAPGPPGRRGGGWLVGLVVVLVVAGALAGLGVWLVHKIGGISIFNSAGCTAVAEHQSYTYDLEQMQNASTITAVGIKLGVPSYGIKIAVATALQESKLYDLDTGDRDSLGLFQQRPSEGWGTSSQILDTTYASTRFYDALLKVPNWQHLDLTVAAQDVQHSAYPGAYANHETEAGVLTEVFTGSAGDALTCALDGPTFSAQHADSSGLTSQGEAVVADAQKQWGTVSIEGVSSGSRAFALALPGGLSTGEAKARGWAYANWAVSKAEALGITSVGYAGETWTASNSTNSWQKTTDAAAAPSNRVVLTMTSGT
jgi:hypothetical protein